jgi:hypothetical protein
MAKVAAATEEERTWYNACHKFYATGDADARQLIEQLEASEDSANRDRYLQLKDAARRQAHAELQAQRAADFAARVDALPASEPPTAWSAVRAARERLSAASGRWRSAPGKARVLGGLTSLLRAQRSSRGGRVLRWVVDSVAVAESGDEAFIDEFFGVLAALAARATLDGDKLRVQVSEAWSDRALGRVYSAAPRPDVAAGGVETTDRARTNADGERDEAVPLAEKLYVLVLDLYVWFCD